MRTRPELQHTPILLLSAKADEELMVKLLDDGAQDFIVKPFSERDLRRPRPQSRAADRRARDDAAQAAESANRAKDEFLAMLGHELRNPLSPILTALQLMKLRGEPGSERERTVIERQVSHLTRLVDDLLDVSRIARGRVELKTEIVEIAEVVAKAIEMASPLLEQREHTLKVDVPRRGLRVDGDPTRLGQVISNLLTNAAKYTPPDGAITVRAERGGRRGRALGARHRHRHRAGRAAARLRPVRPGAAGARSVAGRPGHRPDDRAQPRRTPWRVGVGAQRRAGRGSEFIVRLPADATDAGRCAQPVEAAAAAPCRCRCAILVVDDNEDGAEMLAAALTGKGYDTRVAHDAPAALVAAEFAPDVAFLDLGLPVMDGYELAAHLRELPGLAGLRLIAVTGYGQESIAAALAMPASGTSRQTRGYHRR